MRKHRDETPGVLIRTHRLAAGLTQRQLAETARVSIGVVRDLEQGLTCRPRPDTVRRLAVALGLDARRTEDLLAAVPRHARPVPAHRGIGPSDPPGLRISVLGPLTAWRDGSFIPLGPETQRAVLGLLALHANAAVHREVLIDALWGNEPPTTAVPMIQSYVSRLRRLLDAASPGRHGHGQSLISSGTSYRLSIALSELDYAEFSQLVAAAQDAQMAGKFGPACQLYARALSLWHGDPLADIKLLASDPGVLDLGHQHADAVLGYAEAAFSAGWPDRVVRPLRALHHREPLNERVAARLMVALAGSGCQAEALSVYDEVRLRLDEQLGVYPCPELSETQAMVLRQQIPSAAVAGDRVMLRAVESARESRHRHIPFSVLRGGADSA